MTFIDTFKKAVNRYIEGPEPQRPPTGPEHLALGEYFLQTAQKAGEPESRAAAAQAGAAHIAAANLIFAVQQAGDGAWPEWEPIRSRSNTPSA